MFAGVGVSSVGDFVAWIALMLLVQGMTDSGFAVAAVIFCLFAPSVLLGGYAGLLADRVDHVRLIVIASLAQAAFSAGLALEGSLPVVLGLTLALGVGNAVSQPAEFSMIPRVAGEDRLNEANGWVEAARYAGILFGPILGGALVAAGGAGVALLVNAGSFLFVATAISAVGTPDERPVESDEAEGDLDRARDGAVFILGDRTLAITVLATAIGVLLMSISIPADPFFVRDLLEAGGVGYGAIISAWGVGMVLGATVLARRVPPHVVAAGILVAIVVQGVGKPTGVIAGVVPGALAGYLLGGLGHGVRNVLIRTLLHERSPKRLRGRTFAAYNAMRNGAELFALGIGGLLVTTYGPKVTLLVAGFGQAAIGLLAFFVLRAGAATPAPKGGAPPPSPQIQEVG